MSSKFFSLFEKALRSDEASQKEFASTVGSFVSSFKPEFVENQLFPFLTTWIPRNSTAITSALADATGEFVSVPQAFPAFAPVVESLLASESRAVALTLRTKLRQAKIGGDVFGFFKRLSSSPLDFVRSFVPQIISLLAKEEERSAIISALANDVSFKVRFAVCCSIPQLSKTMSKQIAVTMSNDINSRIRALLPVVCVKLPFFFVSIATPLCNDHDWSVRASLANEIQKSDDVKSALALCCKLVEDKVWQVILSALKSLTALLKRSGKESHEFLQEVVDTLFRVIIYQQTSLKNAVIDSFLAIYVHATLDQEIVSSFVNDVIAKQPPYSRLHFLNSISIDSIQPIVNIMHEKLYSVVVSLMASDQWRIRLGTVQLLNTLAKLDGEDELKTLFSQLCLETLDDEATPVRVAAATELVKFFQSENSGKLYPDCFATLKTSDSFRKRQSALSLLQNIAKTASSEDKAKLLTEMRSFESDSCDNVVCLARKFISLAE